FFQHIPGNCDGAIMRILFLAALLWGLAVSAIRADGPQDNIPDKVRPIPPEGLKVPAEERTKLTEGVQELGQEIELLKKALQDKPALRALVPDVQIYHNAVHYALQHDEFYAPAEIKTAYQFLKQGHERAQLLSKGQAPWL